MHEYAKNAIKNSIYKNMQKYALPTFKLLRMMLPQSDHWHDSLLDRSRSESGRAPTRGQAMPSPSGPVTVPQQTTMIY